MDIKNTAIKFASSRSNVAMAALAVLIIFFGGYAATGYLIAQPSGDLSGTGIRTFRDSGNTIELIDGKPVIRMFSTTSCPHCNWVGPTFDSVVEEYVDQGKIVAYHWELNTGDNTLTPEVETLVPSSETNVFYEFTSPNGGVPTFVFGGKYYRIGNGYESTGNLTAEEAEFRAVIDKLIADSS